MPVHVAGSVNDVSIYIDEGPSLETSKFSLYFSSSCIPINDRKLVHTKYCWSFPGNIPSIRQ
jgi:hypothetical protein